MMGNPGQSNWQDAGCEELKPILKILETEYAIRVMSDKLVDPRSGRSEILVTGDLSPQIVESIKNRIAENPQLIFGSVTIACNLHYSSITSNPSASGEMANQTGAVNTFLLVVSPALALCGFWLIIQSWSKPDLGTLLAGLVMAVLGGFGVVISSTELRTKIKNLIK